MITFSRVRVLGDDGGKMFWEIDVGMDEGYDVEWNVGCIEWEGLVRVDLYCWTTRMLF